MKSINGTSIGAYSTEQKGERETDKQQRKSGKGGSEERMFGFLSPFILNTQSSEKR